MASTFAPKPLWFNPDSLRLQIDSTTWLRGLDLFRKQSVLFFDILAHDDDWIVEGEVLGSKRDMYFTSAVIRLSADRSVVSFNTLCSCPVVRNCKHSVALLLKAAYQGYSVLEGKGKDFVPPPPLSAEQIEAKRLELLQKEQQAAQQRDEQQLLSWLNLLDSAKKRSESTPDSLVDDYRADQWLYLLRSAEGVSGTQVLELTVATSHRKVQGGWAKPKTIRFMPQPYQAIYDIANDADLEVIQLIYALPRPQSRGAYGYQSDATAVLDGQVGLITLQQAASTGKLYWSDSTGYPVSLLQSGVPEELLWRWDTSNIATPDADPYCVLKPFLNSPSAQLFYNSPPLYLDLKQGLCGPTRVQGIAPLELAAFLSAPALKASALQKFQADVMLRINKAVPLPPLLKPLSTLRDIRPLACLHIKPTPPSDRAAWGLNQAELLFDYQGHRGRWIGKGSSVMLDAGDEKLILHRDLDAEQRALFQLADFGLHAHSHRFYLVPGQVSQQLWFQWSVTDYADLRAAGFQVTVDESLVDWITSADTVNITLQSQDADEAASPWFDLSLGIELNGQRHNILPWLPELIATFSKGALDPETGAPELPEFMYVPSPQGSGFVRIPLEPLKPWIAALLELTGDRAYDFDKDSLKLSRFDALRTGAALGQGAVWEGAQALRAMVQQLSGRAELPHIPLPEGVNAELRPYQHQGLNWLQFLREHHLAGILADDMGLGKTLQTLAHIQCEKNGGRLTLPALIIAPVSLMGNWQREAARFCPSLRTVVLHGKDRHDVAASMSECDVVIAPYSLLQRARERWLEASWHLVVLDEAQNIKNATTHAAQVVGLLRTRHRLCLSGTPMENHLGEIWSLFHFLMPGFLGSQTRFKELFRTPIEKQGSPERMNQLRARITPFMLRRTKALVASELPPKVETVMRVELAGQQADLYETIRLGMEKSVREALSTKGLAKSQIAILDALLKLRQVCCDPKLLSLEAAKKVKTSAKLEQLMEMLPEMLAEGRRILLFSQFTSMLTLIEVELKKRKLSWVKLTGQSQKRDALIDQFTSGEVPLFLISLKAGGVGLNLPQADTVIHYDPWWNPAVENQATDRAHRIGQKHSVWVVKLVAQGTIEERILALQERKAQLADSMYSGSNERKQPLFTESDLEELLKPLSAK